MPRRLITVALCAALSACAGQTPAPEGEPTPLTGQSMPETPSTVATPSPPQQRAAIDPASLVGMTSARITALFGTPVFVRRDPPGEFWRYRGKSCVLELFFYRQGGAQRVDHIETRNAAGKTLNRANCVAKLRKPPAQS